MNPSRDRSARERQSYPSCSSPAAGVAQFIRLGRGPLVNLERIACVRLVRGGTCVAVLDNGEEVRVSRIHSRALRSTVLKL